MPSENILQNEDEINFQTKTERILTSREAKQKIPDGNTKILALIKSKEKSKSKYWLSNIRIMFYGVCNIEKIKIHDSKSS